MARGWESKSVEDQIAERVTAQKIYAAPHLTAQEIAVREQTVLLNLTRSHLLAQLTQARNTAHREILQRSLDEIERRLTQAKNAE